MTIIRKYLWSCSANFNRNLPYVLSETQLSGRDTKYNVDWYLSHIQINTVQGCQLTRKSLKKCESGLKASKMGWFFFYSAQFGLQEGKNSCKCRKTYIPNCCEFLSCAISSKDLWGNLKPRVTFSGTDQNLSRIRKHFYAYFQSSPGSGCQNLA